MKKSKSIICLLGCLVFLLQGCVFFTDNTETPSFQNITSENENKETAGEKTSGDETLEQDVTLKDHVSDLLSEEKSTNSAIVEENDASKTDGFEENGYCY